MPTPAITVENLSKLYRLGQVGTGTLSHDLNRLWARLRGKPDPYAKIGATNDRAKDAGDTKSGYVWALKDINFEVQPGEVLGIIGKNGAGKSTLLKLLSRVTAPTTGKIQLNGRVASLLEVGTGFHPELTGRENIFLNGAILGMTRAEIRNRFDDIVDFAGCAKYIDTPVKRYSSGMYVRLAFAVAAHLEPEILIVDEVLAVGDAEFQNRCIGKMKEVSEQGGRTVLFVSHNMGSVRNLCGRSILVEQGTIAVDSKTSEVIQHYLNSGQPDISSFVDYSGNSEATCGEVDLASISIRNPDSEPGALVTAGKETHLEFKYRIKHELKNLRLAVDLLTPDGQEILSTSDFLYQPDSRVRPPGDYQSTCRLPANFLNLGRYVVRFEFDIPTERLVLGTFSVPFEVSELERNQLGITLTPRPSGFVHPELPWNVDRLNAPVSAHMV